MRNKFTEKMKQSFYGGRDATVKLNDAASARSSSSHRSSNDGDNIARLLAAATSAELAVLKQSSSSDAKRQLQPQLNGQMELSCL